MTREEDRADLARHEAEIAAHESFNYAPVSYTHLTLPTSDLVEISVDAGSLKKKKSSSYEEVSGA